MTSGSAHVMIEANAASCDLYCDAHAEIAAENSCGGCGEKYASAHFACMASCEAAVSISAHASLEANASVSIDAAHADAWVGHELDLELDDLLDGDGHTLPNGCD